MSVVECSESDIASANKKLYNLSVITPDIIRRVFSQKEIGYLFSKFQPNPLTIESLSNCIIQAMRDPNIASNPVLVVETPKYSVEPVQKIELKRIDPAYLPPPQKVMPKSNVAPMQFVYPFEIPTNNDEDTEDISRQPSIDKIAEEPNKEEEKEPNDFQKELIQQSAQITEKLENISSRIALLQQKVSNISERIDAF